MGCADPAAFEVAVIDPKKVKALVLAGNLDGQRLGGLDEAQDVDALCLV